MDWKSVVIVALLAAVAKLAVPQIIHEVMAINEPPQVEPVAKAPADPPVCFVGWGSLPQFEIGAPDASLLAMLGWRITITIEKAPLPLLANGGLR
ncbi:MAG: hypothetical protein AB7O57_09290 [Hyphomicrobiaceae bacterium]